VETTACVASAKPGTARGEKVEATQFPSVALLNRLDGLIARLDEAERVQAAAAQ
jgi:hypothetical protein